MLLALSYWTALQLPSQGSPGTLLSNVGNDRPVILQTEVLE